MKTILKDDLTIIEDRNAENVVDFVPYSTLPKDEPAQDILNRLKKNSSLPNVVSGGSNQLLDHTSLH